MPDSITLENPTFNTATMSKLQWALAIAAHGLPVFPLQYTNPDGSCTCGDLECTSQGKHPLTGSHGWKDATTDAAEITTLWTAHPDANIAIHPGEDYVYIDLDVKHPPISGYDSLAEYLGISREEMLGMTYAVETATGGLHMYFSVVDAKANGVDLLPGVDVRGQGGHVVAPGSTIYLKDEFGDFYEAAYKAINDLEVQPLPDSIAQLLSERMERDPNADIPSFPEAMDSDAAQAAVRAYAKKRKPAVWGQGGDAHTLVTIYQCRDLNVSAEVCLEILTEPGGWNERCEPPCDESEIQVKIDNAFKYAKKPLGNRQDLIDLFELKNLMDGDSRLPADLYDDAAQIPQGERFERLYNPWTEYNAPRFPFETLPAIVRDFAVNSAENIGGDKSGMAMSCLAAISMAIDHETICYLKPGDSFPVRPAIWVALIGDSATSKTWLQRAAIGPLQELNDKWQAEHWAKVRAVDEGALADDAKKKELSELGRNAPPRLIVNDTTPEKLADILSRQNRGIGIYRDELIALIGSMDQYGGAGAGVANRGFYLQARDGGSYTQDRVTRGTIAVKNLSVTILGAIQPKRLKDFKKLGDDGLLQRFMPVVLGDSEMSKEHPDTSANPDWKALIERLVDYQARTLQLSPGARKEFRRVQTVSHDLKRTYREMGSFASFIGKLDGMWGSLALLLHMAWEGKVLNSISVETALRASRIVEDFILPHAYIFYLSLNQDVQGDDQSIARVIVEHLTKGSETITWRDFQRGTECCRADGVKPTAKLMGFTSGGWLIPDSQYDTCRKWAINPAVTGFAVEAAEQRRKHQEMVSKIKLTAATKKNEEEVI